MFDAEFFPTPTNIVHMMISKISKDAIHFLEPSAGKGNIADVLQEKGGRYSRYQIDVIERVPELVTILQGKGYPVVGFDFLEYEGVCYYDAILMNPPFSNGDDHLIKAWNFLHHGEIVCLLNEETIKNPHSKTRKLLKEIIERNGYVEFLGDCFKDGERKTGVKVALVYLKKVAKDDQVDLWERGGSEKDHNTEFDSSNLLAVQDKLGNMQHFYDEANFHMIEAFKHLRKASVFMKANSVHLDSHSRDEIGLDKIMEMALSNVHSAKAEFLKKHRNKAWHSVFKMTDFVKWLDKKQTEEMLRDINKNANIPFTKDNIKGTLQNVFLERGNLFKKSVVNVFDELRRYDKDNTNHDEGWKTNSNYKVNKKLIFPYGVQFENFGSGGYFTFRYHGSSIDIYRDLDRVMCVLDGKDFNECNTIENALRAKFDAMRPSRNNGDVIDITKEAESDYFKMKFFKKGTLHLMFKHEHLWSKFNVTASEGKMELGR